MKQIVSVEAAPLRRVESVAEAEQREADEQRKRVARLITDVDKAKRSIFVREEARRQLEVEKATGLFGGFSGVSMSRRIADGLNSPEPWLIDGLAKRRYNVELLAVEKAGKTVLVDNLIRALVLGESFLGADRFATHFPEAAAVGVLDYELDPADTDEQIARIFGDELLGADRVFIENLRGTGFTLANEHHAEQVVEWCVEHGIKFLVIDVFGEAMRGFGSENFTDDAAAYMFTLRRIAHEAGLLGTLTVHHASRDSAREARQSGSGAALKGRGSARIEASMDAIWQYDVEQGGTRYLSAKGRGRIEVDEVPVSFDPESERLTAEKALVSAGISGGENRLHTKAVKMCRVLAAAGGSYQGQGAFFAYLRSKGVGGRDGDLTAVRDYAKGKGWVSVSGGNGLPIIVRLTDDQGWR